MRRGGRILDGERHVRAALIVVNDVGGHVVDRGSGRVGRCGEDTADDGDRVPDFRSDVQAEDDGNAGLDVRQDGVGDVRGAEAEGLIARLADGPEHAIGRQEVRSCWQGRGFVRCCRGGEARDFRH